jgi:hypothetical protein
VAADLDVAGGVVINSRKLAKKAAERERCMASNRKRASSRFRSA